MRKLVAVLVCATFLAGLLSAPVEAAKKKRKPKKVVRTAEFPYSGGATGSADLTGTCVVTDGCFSVPVTASESFITMEVTDDLGLPVPVTVAQDTNPGDQFTEVVTRFCGSTSEPVAIAPGIPVDTFLWALPSATLQCAGGATSGTLTVELSNLP